MTNDYERYNFWHLELEQFEEKRKEEIAKYNKEIDEAVERVRNGGFITHEEVMKDMKNW